MATADQRITDLVRRHTAYRSVTELGRAIGDPQLANKLRHARKNHQLPDGKTLARIAEELDPVGLNLLVDALAWDGKLPGYGTAERNVGRQIRLAIRKLTPDQRRALLLFLGVTDYEQEDDDRAPGPLDGTRALGRSAVGYATSRRLRCAPRTSARRLPSSPVWIYRAVVDSSA